MHAGINPVNTEVVLIPQFRSISRAVTASFQASALYSSEREKLGTDIQDELARVTSPRGIVVETTPLRNVALPSQLTDAIEQKQRAEQESQRMEYPGGIPNEPDCQYIVLILRTTGEPCAPTLYPAACAALDSDHGCARCCRRRGVADQRPYRR